MEAKYSSVTDSRPFAAAVPMAHENNGETASPRWHFVFWQLETDKRAIIFVCLPHPLPTHLNSIKLFHAALRENKTLLLSLARVRGGFRVYQSAVFHLVTYQKEVSSYCHNWLLNPLYDHSVLRELTQRSQNIKNTRDFFFVMEGTGAWRRSDLLGG